MPGPQASKKKLEAIAVSADPIIYCLERLTDYRQFERLCSDVMAGLGIPNIEPIGGASDRGRDAIHSTLDGLTIFAYTVRADWRAKLEQDCERIRVEKHNPSSVVFACTSTLSGSDKDSAKSQVKSKFGWELDIYDLERLRIALASPLHHLVAQHPAIFCPPWFPQRGGLSISASADTVVIDHVEADHALATWLDRRLSLAGFQTWCRGTAPLAGEDTDETTRVLIEKRAVQYLPLLSRESLANRPFMERTAVAGARNGLVLPCWAESVADLLQQSRIARLAPARFDGGWAIGLDAVIGRLQTSGIKPRFGTEQGRGIALRAYVPEPVTKPIPERVFANVFRVEAPKSILVYEPVTQDQNEDIENLRHTWAFAVVSGNQWLAFQEPPAPATRFLRRGHSEFAWAEYKEFSGRNTAHIVKELIRRSLDVACKAAGLNWCPDRHLYYFPPTGDRNHNVSFQHVDGRNTRVAVTGEKQLGWGERASHFQYQLAPLFRPGRDEDGIWWVTMRLYVRVTNMDGVPYQLKEITRRRKAVTKGWWNKEWLARVLGVMQALRNSGNTIQVGNGRRAVVIGCDPLQWECPISIDIDAMTRFEDFQREMAAAREATDDDDDIDEDSGTRSGEPEGDQDG